jgi:hypothetical protein
MMCYQHAAALMHDIAWCWIAVLWLWQLRLGLLGVLGAAAKP